MKDTKVSFIIKNKLAAFVYMQHNDIDVLQKKLSDWHDMEYLFDFYEKNQIRIGNNPMVEYCDYSFEDFAEDIMSDLVQLEDFISYLKNNDVKLDDCFAPLSRNEGECKILSFKKRRCKWLRIYAIRIDENLYVITGGAIKITKTMQEHNDTKNELAQLNYSRQWLEHEGIETDEVFYSYFELKS